MRALAFALLLVTSWLAAETLSQEALIDAVRTGGHVIFVRHADTTGEPRDATMDLTDRANQRNLSAHGRAQAAALGDGIRRLGLPVGRVATSPVFRARDTAELAFGADAVDIDVGLTADDYVAGSYQPFIEAHRALLSTPPKESNTWLFGHWIPLSMAVPGPITSQTLEEDAAAVFLPKPEGFTLLGILTPPWWESGVLRCFTDVGRACLPAPHCTEERRGSLGGMAQAADAGSSRAVVPSPRMTGAAERRKMTVANPEADQTIPYAWTVFTDACGPVSLAVRSRTAFPLRPWPRLSRRSARTLARCSTRATT